MALLRTSSSTTWTCIKVLAGIPASAPTRSTVSATFGKSVTSLCTETLTVCSGAGAIDVRTMDSQRKFQRLRTPPSRAKVSRLSRLGQDYRGHLRPVVLDAEARLA